MIDNDKILIKNCITTRILNNSYKVSRFNKKHKIVYYKAISVKKVIDIIEDEFSYDDVTPYEYKQYILNKFNTIN